MSQAEQIKKAIIKNLSTVIDPETGADVIRMHLIEDLRVSEDGFVTYKFRPSSYVCPLAVHLSLAIQRAVKDVKGVTGQELKVVGYIQEDELTKLLKEV